MTDTRQKDGNWRVTGADGKVLSVQHAQLAVSMDIRDELKRLNDLLHCINFRRIPRKLDRISANTANLPKANKKDAKR